MLVRIHALYLFIVLVVVGRKVSKTDGFFLHYRFFKTFNWTLFTSLLRRLGCLFEMIRVDLCRQGGDSMMPLIEWNAAILQSRVDTNRVKEVEAYLYVQQNLYNQI